MVTRQQEFSAAPGIPQHQDLPAAGEKLIPPQERYSQKIL
jgi:hypothetical protein